jgi:hypothetical protein
VLRFFDQINADPLPGNAATEVAICTATCGGETSCEEEHAPQVGFIQVTTAPVAVDWLLWPLMQAFGVETLTSANAAASAIAGANVAVCGAAPLFICKPPVPLIDGVQIKAVGKGGEKWFPGNWGFLDAFDGNSTNAYRDAIASLAPTDQCTGYTVGLKPGNATAARVGFDVRFDIFPPGVATNDFKNEPMYPTAKNVTKGQYTKKSSQNCDPKDDSDLMGLPRDSCFKTNTCSYGNRFGDGTWACADYWQKNHPGKDVPSGCSNTPTITRWDLYQHELANGIPKGALEDGNPTCSNQSWSPSEGELDRREFIVAVIDCTNLPKPGGNIDDVPVIEYARMFMTEPAGGSPDNEIWLEYIEVGNAENLSVIFKEYPLLYR